MDSALREVRVALTEARGYLSIELGQSSSDLGWHSQITNLSRSGMFVRIDRPVALGEVIHFAIESPHASERRVSGSGIVRWARNTDQGPMMPKGIGLRVTEFEHESQSIWLGIIERCLGELEIVDLLNPDMVSCHSGLVVSDLVANLSKRNQTIAVVVDDSRQPIGIVTEAELIKHLFMNQFLSLNVGTIMESSFAAFSSTNGAYDIFQAFRRPGVNHVLITEDSALLGVVSAVSVMPLMTELMDLRARRLKQSFNRAMDMIIHDLRSPISIIKTANELLLTKAQTPDQYLDNGFAGIVEENCELMLKLIDQLLSVSSDGFNAAAVNLGELSLSGAVRHCYLEFRPQAEAKHQSLVLEESGNDLRIMGDPQRLEQILQNLLSNALKYSQIGASIQINLSTQGSHAILKVTDNGPGIPAEEIPRIFDEYCQISTKPTSGERSTGLGLSICKRLVEAHHGQISVRSEVGTGSTFIVQLPLLKTLA